MNNKIHNAIFGMAYGDSWGFLLEFQSFGSFKNRETPFPQSARITDDTQMSLYALRGIENAIKNIKNLEAGDYSEKNIIRIRTAIAEQFLIWLHDPKNNRAPGNACLTALHKLEARQEEISGLFDRRTLTGIEGTQSNSKGCGANMRNPWFGLFPYSEETIEELSLIQAEITHSHPLAYSSAVLTALLVKALANGEITPIKGKTVLFDWLVSKTDALIQRNTHARARYKNGLEQMKEFLLSREMEYRVASSYPNDTDICQLISSEGWVAEEALLLATIAVELHADNPVSVLHRAVRTTGDSDSIAAIAGTMIGATMKSEWPEDWSSHLEINYFEELSEAVVSVVKLT